jgi:hypothetical protein
VLVETNPQRLGVIGVQQNELCKYLLRQKEWKLVAQMLISFQNVNRCVKLSKDFVVLAMSFIKL